jgi:Imidazoleglycerol-phosphate synthase
VNSVEQAGRIIGLGVAKVTVSSASLENSQLISMMAEAIGAQSVVVVFDVRKSASGETYEIWTHNGHRSTGRSVPTAAQEAESLGAGEVVINPIDRDGTMTGYDVPLAAKVRESIRIPMAELGGLGSLNRIGELIGTCGVIGRAAGSLVVFKGPYCAVLLNYPSPAQKDALLQPQLTAFGNVQASEASTRR